MQFKIKNLSLLMGIVLTSTTTSALANEAFSLQVDTMNKNGQPSFVSGNLGVSTPGNAAQALKNIVSTETSYNANGNEDFTVRRQWIDSLGKTHTHFDQTINGLKVYGANMIIHANASAGGLLSSSTAGNVYAVSGNLAVDSNSASSLNIQAFQSNKNSSAQATAFAQSIGQVSSKPELAYVYLPESSQAKLSWKIEVKYDSTEGFEHDIVFFDASTSEELTRHPQVFRAKSHKTYTMNNQVYSHSSAPGTLQCSTGQTCSEASANRAHNGTSSVYDYYSNKHGRDGINGSGMTMISSVHTGSNWNNAVWYNNQMFYGDGDGTQFGDFTLSFDIIGHELTHGVTQFTANLVYANASGALNEAMSDILGVSADAYQRGSSQPIWLLGGAAYTPGTAGDALRYMKNPTQDGYSKDYYPERIPFVSNPNNTNDQGGVHGNSGIANLAYALLIDGGTHPRNKTTANVPGIGLTKAEKIFYRALTTYFNSSTDFNAARTGTAQAAQDLYGATEKTAVETAWCAVGVGSCPTTTPPPTGGNVLTNNVAKTGLGASTGSDIVFTMVVPSGATDISFTMSGGTGDADMYVKFGSTPTDSSYDCRPYKGGNAESCTGTSTGGTYYVRLKAYSTFAGASLTGKYTEASTGGNQPVDVTQSNITVASKAWAHYTYVLPAGYSSMTVSMSGGSGDADLYVRRGAQSTTTTYDCRPYKTGNIETCSFNSPAAGTWYLDIYGYTAASGVTVNLQATP